MCSVKDRNQYKNGKKIRSLWKLLIDELEGQKFYLHFKTYVLAKFRMFLRKTDVFLRME